MNEQLLNEFNEINSNLEILPTNNAENKKKYIDYLDFCLDKYRPMLEEAKAEINVRLTQTQNKYRDLTLNLEDDSIDYLSLKLSDSRVFSDEKMNLPYLFYKLRNLDNSDLKAVNDIINKIIDSFKNTGIILKDTDFNYSDNVNKYMKALLLNDKKIQDIFNEIYFETSDLLIQIELNFRYLYYKNKNKIDDYYKQKYSTFDFNKFISNHRQIINNNEKIKHGSVKYIYDKFMNKEYDPEDFISESRVQNLFSKILTDPANERNYENLIKLKNALYEYKGCIKYEYIINDFKELYTHKEEYKDLFQNKLKEISKKEKNIFSLNKKINKKGLFKLNKNKLAAVKSEKNKVILELSNDYKELDDLKIKHYIFNFTNEESDYYNALKFASYDFVYFVELLEKDNEELNIENIDKHLLNLNKYLYDNDISIINNVGILDEKDLPKIISEMFKLNSLILETDSLSSDVIDKEIEIVDKTLIYFDIYTLMINLADFDYLLKAPETLNK